MILLAQFLPTGLHKVIVYRKTFISDLCYVSYLLNNVITNRFIDRKDTPNKKNYLFYFVGISIYEHDISLTNKIVCNFIGDFYNITDDLILSVIKMWQRHF